MLRLCSEAAKSGMNSGIPAAIYILVGTFDGKKPTLTEPAVDAPKQPFNDPDPAPSAGRVER